MTNLSLFDEYLIDEERIKIILLDLTEDDFCEKVQNKHVQFQHCELSNRIERINSEKLS